MQEAISVMTATEIFTYVANLEQECQRLRKALEDKRSNSVDAERFYAVTMTVEETARFHKVSAARVRDYAKRGLIETHPDSTDAKMLFHAKTVLTLDFPTLKKKKALLKWE